MNDSVKKIIYRLDDKISFRKCSLFHGKSASHGDCTCFSDTEENWKRYFYCKQDGIHLQCTIHPEIEFDLERQSYGRAVLKCPKCNEPFEIDDFDETINKCLRMLNIEALRDAQLIRLDDWYVPEVKGKKETVSDYWLKTDVKTDKDGDTIIVVYVGHKGSKEKAQFFIKPEKLQLTSDHKDLDPAKVLAKIEVTLKNRMLSQEYDN